jgi:hypothetical protein
MPSNCANCGIPFSVEPEELAWIAENDADSPGSCPRCRAFLSGYQDESITCTICGKVFIYPRELRLFSRLFSWPRPRRCLGGCRRAAPEMTETEKKMADFLKRLRAARQGRIGSTPSLRKMVSTGAARSSSSTERTVEGGEGLGGSLAQALKEFQEKKRRRS